MRYRNPAGVDFSHGGLFDGITQRREFLDNLPGDDLGPVKIPEILVETDPAPLSGRLFAAKMRQGRPYIPDTLEIILEFEVISHIELVPVTKKTFHVLCIHNRSFNAGA